MTIAELIVLGVALSADAFAVTISNCFAYAGDYRRLLLMPVFFGFFQALMPALGYVAGGVAAELIERYSSVVIFVILGLIGGNMIREGVLALRGTGEGGADGSEEAPACVAERLSMKTLVAQAIATAIDAFAVGISFRASAVDLPVAVSIIGITTLACCFVGIAIGRRLGKLLGDRAEVVGGAVLVLIGVKALVGL